MHYRIWWKRKKSIDKLVKLVILSVFRETVVKLVLLFWYSRTFSKLKFTLSLRKMFITSRFLQR